MNTGTTPDAREGTPLKFLTVVPHDTLSWEEVIVMQTIQIIILKRYVRFKPTGRIIQNPVTPRFPIGVLVFTVFCLVCTVFIIVSFMYIYSFCFVCTGLRTAATE